MHETFTSYLQGKFWGEYHGDKEHFEDAFENWLSGKGVDEMVELGEEYGKVITF